MNRKIAFLRAVNVGGTGKIEMVKLKALFESLGCQNVATYIQSGNVLFENELIKEEEIEKAIFESFGIRTLIYFRTKDELQKIISNNPFPDQNGSKVLISLFKDEIALPLIIKNQKDEEIIAMKKEIYINFASGQGNSKLQIKQFDIATNRNLNTITKLFEMA